VNDRRNGIEEGERVLARAFGDRVRERGRGERPGGDDHALPIRGRQPRDLLAADIDQRMGGERGGDGSRKPLAVDCQRSPGRDLIEVRGAHDEGAKPAHLLVQQTYGVVLLVVGAKRVRADQFGEQGGLVSGSGA